MTLRKINDFPWLLILFGLILAVVNCDAKRSLGYNSEQNSQNTSRSESKGNVFNDEIDSIKAFIKLDPTDPTLHFQLGYAYRNKALLNQSDQEFSHLMNGFDSYMAGDLRSTQDSLSKSRAATRLNHLKYNPAIEEFQTAIQLKPDYYEAYMELGLTYGCVGEVQKQIQAYQGALKIRPNDPKALSELASTYAGHFAFEEALSLIRDALKSNPSSPVLHFALGKIYLQQRKRDQALIEYKILKDMGAKEADELFGLIYQ